MCRRLTRKIFVAFCATTISACVGLIQKRAQFDSSLPNLLTIASTHGAGTTMLCSALEKHPCMLSVGEPFGGDEHLYAPSGSTDVNAIFRDNFEGDPDGTYEKLAFKLNGTLGFDKLDRDFHLRTNSPQGFFEAVREQACEYYDLPPMCKGRCILAYKMFPDYICNDFEQVHSYLRDPRIGVVHMMRDEAAVSASNARRFNGYSDWKVDRDLRWKDFLTNISKRELTGHNVWMELNAEDIFPSADAYMKKVKQMLSMLDLDDQAMLAPVDHYIRRKFDEISANNHTAR